MGTCFWRRQVFEYHPLIGWWHLPNLYARVPLGQTYHRVITNAVGMRSERNYPKVRTSGRKRVIFLGDSYTAGDGVSNGDRFTDLLERRYPNLDAMNFGLNGSGTDQQLLILESMAREYEADALVICICVENIARNLYDCFPSFDWREQLVAYRPKPNFVLNGGKLELHNTPVPKERRMAGELGDWHYGFPYIPGENDAYAIYKDSSSLHWLTMKAILCRMFAGVSGVPVFIVPMPMYNHYLGDNGPTYLPRFAELADDDRSIHLVDLLPAMHAVPMVERRGFRFPDDPHYTAAAHKLVADALEYQFALRAPNLLD
jgi:carbamoyltransferase